MHKIGAWVHLNQWGDSCDFTSSSGNGFQLNIGLFCIIKEDVAHFVGEVNSKDHDPQKEA